MGEELVSVVVPVYNTEKYLDRCVSSIVGQTYSALEILLIDDGSPDGCPGLCDGWAQKDHRIRVIHKQNEGLGEARNTGIRNARGAYICFFDSDDYVAPDLIEKAMASAKEHGSELICFGMYTVNRRGEVKRGMIPSARQLVYSQNEVTEVFLPRLVGPDPRTGEGDSITMSACSKLFSMELIRRTGWRFVSEREIISEDFYSLLKLLADMEKVSILPEGLYFYCENQASLTRKYRPERFERVCHFYEEILLLCQRMGYSREVAFRLGVTYLSFVITALKQTAAAEIPAAEKRRGLKDALSNELLQQVLREHRGDRLALKKRVLFFVMRHRMVAVSWFLLAAQNSMKH